MEYIAAYDSPMGPLKLLSDGVNLTGLYMEKTEQDSDLPVFTKAKQWLDAYFQGGERDFDFPLKPEGTAFQQRIWTILLTIPYGSTRTYGDIVRQAALELGKEKMSAQAVGQAVGRNPISILIPCHRCVGAKGKLTGYTGGMEYKKWLLRHEGWTVTETEIRSFRECAKCDM